MEAPKEMPKPTGQHQKLEMLVGRWGPGMHARLTHDLTREGVLRSRMDLSRDGAEWVMFFECDYERE